MQAREPGQSPSLVVVQIQTLGGFSVLVKGQPISARDQAQRKPLALMKLLIACDGNGAAVERVLDVLWPDLDGDRARQAFAVALHRLRRIVGTEAVALTGGTARVNPAICHLDLTEFKRCELEAEHLAARRAAPAEARAVGKRLLAVYRGPFLDGDFSCAEILSARTSLHDRFLGALRKLGRHLERAGAQGDAIWLYQRGLDVDWLSEELCQALIECQHRAGRSADGLLTYRRYADALRSAVNAEPSAALQARMQELELAVAGGPDALPGPVRTLLPEVHEMQLPAASPAREPAAPEQILAGWGPRRGWSRRSLLTGAPLAVPLVAAGWFGSPWLRNLLFGDESDPAALLERDGFPRYRRPTVAVLPFETPAALVQATPAVQGLSDRLTTALTVLPDVRVASRASVEVIEADRQRGRELARERGIDHLVEGQVYRRDGLFHVAPRIVDIATDTNLWAQTFAVEPSRLHAAPDKVALRMARAISARIAYGPREFLGAQSLFGDAPSWEVIVDAVLASDPNPRTHSLRALRHYEQLLERFPDSPALLGAAAMRHADNARHYWTPLPTRAWAEARRLAERANERDPAHARGSAVLAYYHSHHGNHDGAAAEIERFITAYPEDPINHRLHAEILMFLGRIEESLAAIRRAARRSPAYPAHLFTILELDHYLAGHYKLAAAASTVALQRVPRRERSRVLLTVVEQARGRHAAARASAQELLRIRPDFGAYRHAKWVFTPFRDQGPRAAFEQYLVEAGLPA